MKCAKHIVLALILFQAIAFAKKVTLRWEKVPDAHSYQIEIFQGKKLIVSEKLSSETNSWTGPLAPGIYRYEISVYDRLDQKSEYHNENEIEIEPDPEPDPIVAPPDWTPAATPAPVPSDSTFGLRAELGALSYGYTAISGIDGISTSAVAGVFGLRAQWWRDAKWGFFMQASDRMFNIENQLVHQFGFELGASHVVRIAEKAFLVPSLGFSARSFFHINPLSRLATHQVCLGPSGGVSFEYEVSPRGRFSFSVGFDAFLAVSMAGSGVPARLYGSPLGTYRFSVGGTHDWLEDHSIGWTISAQRDRVSFLRAGLVDRIAIDGIHLSLFFLWGK